MLSRPRDYQKRGVTAVMRAFANHSRAQVNMASGTGKTVLAIGVWEKLAPRRTVLFVPTLALARQTVRVWQEELGASCPPLLALASKGVGVPTYSDVPSLRAQLRRLPSSVLVSTYQSSPKLEGFSFDLGIYDEAHRTASISRPGVDPANAATLRSSVLRCSKRLFMTATTKVYSDPGALREEGFTVFSMDDRAYGEQAFAYAPAAAMADGVLAPFRVVVPVVTDGEVQSALSSHRARIGNKRGSAEEVATYIGLSKTILQFKIAKAFAFTRTVMQARRFAGELDGEIGFPDLHPGAAFQTSTIYGGLSKRVATQRLDHFEKATHAALSNPRSLVEGIDLPDVDCVAFLYPRKSQLVIAQAIGRLLRRRPGKVGTVVCPLYIPDDNVRASHVDAILRVVSLLERSTDPLVVSGDEHGASTGPCSYADVHFLAPEGFDVGRLRRAVAVREVHQGRLRLTEERVRRAVQIYVDSHGEAPTARSGDAEPYLELPLTWKTVVERWRYEGIGSWREWLQSEGFIKVRALSEASIVAAAKAYRAKHGVPPRMDSGDATPFFDIGTIRWVNVERALRRGHLGLPGNDSLSSLLRRHGLRPPRGDLTTAQIDAAIKAFHRATGSWPNRKSGDASAYLGEPLGSTTWEAVHRAGSEGKRGLPKGRTLLTAVKSIRGETIPPKPCPVCGDRVSVQDNGKLYPHRTPRCAGSLKGWQ